MSIPSKTILLVEDEAVIALTEKFTLEKYGYAVLHVNTGEKAIAAVETKPGIDLILMDIDLGDGIDGTQAAETILQNHDIPIVFVSSHSEREVVEKTEKITSYGYVLKSSSITVLDASIKMAFKLFEAYHQVQKRSDELYGRTQLLENILEHFPGTVFWKDTDSIYQGCNSGFAQAAGLRDSSEIIGMTDFDLPWNTSEAPSYRADDSQVMSSMIPKLHIEETQHFSNGEFRWLDTSKLPLFNSDGQVIGVLGVSTDTSEKKRQESHLRKLILAIEQSPTTIVITDTDGYIEYVNPKFLELTGYSRDEVMGENPRILKSDTTPTSIYPELWNTIKGGGIWKGVFRNKRKDGSLYTEATLIAPVTDENRKQIAYIAVKEDITERERITEELHDSNVRYRQMLDSIPVLVWESDVDGRCSYVNEYRMKFTGQNMEQHSGEWWLSNVHPDDREQYVRLSAEAFRDHKPVVTTYRLRRFDGEFIMVLDHGNPRYSSSGQFLGFTGVCIELNQSDPCRPHNS